MDRTRTHTDQGFIQSFCAHGMTRYGLCIMCGAVTTKKMRDHLWENYQEGDCPLCAYAEPDSVYEGSPVDWTCKKIGQPCQLIRGGEREGMICNWYWSRKVELK